MPSAAPVGRRSRVLVVSGSRNALPGDRLLCDTRNGSVSITLPASPSIGAEVELRFPYGPGLGAVVTGLGWPTTNTAVVMRGVTLTWMADGWAFLDVEQPTPGSAPLA